MVEPSLSHLNAKGEVHMVEVGDRASTERCATAEGCIAMQPEVLELVLQRRAPKGDVLAVARIAAIQHHRGKLSLLTEEAAFVRRLMTQLRSTSIVKSTLQKPDRIVRDRTDILWRVPCERATDLSCIKIIIREA